MQVSSGVFMLTTSKVGIMCFVRCGKRLDTKESSGNFTTPKVGRWEFYGASLRSRSGQTWKERYETCGVRQFILGVSTVEIANILYHLSLTTAPDVPRTTLLLWAIFFSLESLFSNVQSVIFSHFWEFFYPPLRFRKYLIQVRVLGLLRKAQTQTSAQSKDRTFRTLS